MKADLELLAALLMAFSAGISYAGPDRADALGFLFFAVLFLQAGLYTKELDDESRKGVQS